MTGKEKLADWQREEVRGLFTLGLMAILITLRVTQTEITINLFGHSYIITEIIDITLVCWGIYAFLIVVWLSSDWLPKRWCDLSYVVGTSMLLWSFLLFYITGIALFSTLPLPWHLITYPLLIPSLYLAIKAISKGIHIIIWGLRFLISYLKRTMKKSSEAE